MSDLSCLFTIVHTREDESEALIRELVAPVTAEVRDLPQLDSLFYGCFSYPEPQVRFRILGERSWVEGSLRERMEHAVAALERSGLVRGHEFGRYAREVERYGGEEGMRLTERIYHHDSIACVELIEADARGRLARSRREISVAMTERLLDLLRFEGTARLAFYEFAGRWPSPEGDWQEGDHASLDRRYEALRDGLALLASDRGDSAAPSEVWGGDVPAGIAGRCLEALAPVMERVLEAHRAGRIRQDLVYLAWSWAHLHCNRLGIPAVPEAILRQLMLRHYRARADGRS